METTALTRLTGTMPTVLDDVFRPWSDVFDNSRWNVCPMNMAAVNIVENQGGYQLSLAAPGLKKEDFKVDVDANMLTITSEKEENKEVNNKKFARKEYGFSSFSRSFSLPEEIHIDNIDAKYEDGVLKISMPRKKEVQKQTVKKIAVK
jgi:HSP20 family protein